MQKMKWIFLFIMSLSLGTATLSAQEILKEGTIKYQITDVSSDNPQAQQQLQMMKGSTMKIINLEDKQLTTSNMMNGMVQQRVLFNKEKKEMAMYLDRMGQKMKTVMPMSEMEKNKQEISTEIKYFPEETKEIAGYDTYKAVIINKVGEQEMEMTIYITEDFSSDAQVIQGMSGTDKLKGFPLEFTVTIPQLMSMTYTAQEVSTEVDKSEFDFDKSGYKELSPEQLQQMGGGMGGM